MSDRYEQFERVGTKHRVAPEILHAQWDTESDLGRHPDTWKKGKRDQGHFQVYAGARSDMRRAGIKADPWSRNVTTASEGPAWYLGMLRDRYDGDWVKAVAAYNWGMGNIDNKIAQHGDKWLQHCRGITRRYVSSVLLANIPDEVFERALAGDTSMADDYKMTPRELIKTAETLADSRLIARGQQPELMPAVYFRINPPDDALKFGPNDDETVTYRGQNLGAVSASLRNAVITSVENDPFSLTPDCVPGLSCGPRTR